MRRQDARELPVGAEEGFDPLEVLNTCTLRVRRKSRRTMPIRQERAGPARAGEVSHEKKRLKR